MDRPADRLRPFSIEEVPSLAAGAIMAVAGQTRVICTASVADAPPKWIRRDAEGRPGHGWVTAEYAMMPGSTPERQRRGPGSRATEIQRLIARSLRAAVDLDAMPGLSITCDCDVLVADGGTRTASVTGACVALRRAVRHALQAGRIREDPWRGNVAAVSVGLVGGVPTLDLDYPLDSSAEVDLNVVMNAAGRFVEVQGTGERGDFGRSELDAMLGLAEAGIRELMLVQDAAL